MIDPVAPQPWMPPLSLASTSRLTRFLSAPFAPVRNVFSIPFTTDMAWRCSGSTNTELIENLFRGGLIKDPTVKDAFLKVLSHLQNESAQHVSAGN